jgi:hypothetical protein
VTFTVTVSNLGPGAAIGATLSEGLSVTATVDSATPSQGSCAILAHGIECDLGMIPTGGSATVAIVGTPGSVGTLTSNVGVAESGADPNPGNDLAPVQVAVTTCPFPAPVVAAPVSVAPQTTGLTASASWAPDTSDVDGDRRRSPTDRARARSRSIPATRERPCSSRSSTPRRLRIAGGERAGSVDFLDVPPENGFHDFIDTVARHGVTAGCGQGNFCPANPVNRAQMAVFLLKAKLGAAHVPPPASGTLFLDVPADAFAADWIEELASLGITGGCGGGNYCPDAGVTRAQMAVFLLKTANGSSYTPPVATGIFGDVPVGAFAADWIENPLRAERHRRLQREPAALLPGQPEYARPDGGLPDEDVQSAVARSAPPAGL